MVTDELINKYNLGVTWENGEKIYRGNNAIEWIPAKTIAKNLKEILKKEFEVNASIVSKSYYDCSYINMFYTQSTAELMIAFNDLLEDHNLIAEFINCLIDKCFKPEDTKHYNRGFYFKVLELAKNKDPFIESAYNNYFRCSNPRTLKPKYKNALDFAKAYIKSYNFNNIRNLSLGFDIQSKDINDDAAYDEIQRCKEYLQQL